MKHPRTLEIAVDTRQGVTSARGNGADRIEACSDLPNDGFTPDDDLVRAAVDTGLPVFAMVRPPGSGFRPNERQLGTMRNDIARLTKLGVLGFVFGVLDGFQRLDQQANQELVKACGELPATLHRAFDRTPDLHAALDLAIHIGFARILTSGGEDTALAGADRLSDLVHLAKGHIQICPGGGIRSHNVMQLLRDVHTLEVHSGCRTADGRDTDPVQVRALRDELGPGPKDHPAPSHL